MLRPCGHLSVHRAKAKHKHTTGVVGCIDNKVALISSNYTNRTLTNGDGNTGGVLISAAADCVINLRRRSAYQDARYAPSFVLQGLCH